MEDGYFTVEVVCQSIEVTPAVVRRYVRLGLVAPSVIHGRTALFSESDLARLRKIVRLRRDLGLNPAGVEIVLRLTDELEALRRDVPARLKET